MSVQLNLVDYGIQAQTILHNAAPARLYEDAVQFDENEGARGDVSLFFGLTQTPAWLVLTPFFQLNAARQEF